MKKNILILAFAALTFSAFGQGISESVTVEGRYVPEIISADRLSLLPTTIALTAPESPMSYDRRGVTANFAPDALNMPATGWRARKAFDTSRGYVDMWLGSWLNASLSAGFAAINREDTRLNVWLQHNSTSLWRPWGSTINDQRSTTKDRRFVYDEKIGGEFTRRFLGLGTLNADLQYHLGYFNYYGVESEDAPTQTLNDVYARVGWKGPEGGRLSYSGDADLRYFGYRAMYYPNDQRSTINDQESGFGDRRAGTDAEHPTHTQGARETVFNIGGDVAYSLSDEAGNGSAVGIGLRYSQVFNSEGNDVKRVEATPAYTLTGRYYSLRLGVNLAAVGYGQRKFRVAPDVQFGYRKGKVAFSASAGGGTHLRTLAWKSMMDYYSDPGTGCYIAAYSPIDARIGVQLNPGGRWTVGIEGAWRTTLDETFGGWYMAMINDQRLTINDQRSVGKIRGYSLAVNGGYEFCRYLALKGRATWQPQDGEKGYLNGFDRPEFTAEVTAESSPIDKLSLRLDYRLRAKRFAQELRVKSQESRNFSRLDLGGSYRVTERVAVGIQLNNLLNRHECLLPGVPLEGFNAAAGFQITF